VEVSGSELAPWEEPAPIDWDGGAPAPTWEPTWQETTEPWSEPSSAQAPGDGSYSLAAPEPQAEEPETRWAVPETYTESADFTVEPAAAEPAMELPQPAGFEPPSPAVAPPPPVKPAGAESPSFADTMPSEEEAARPATREVLPPSDLDGPGWAFANRAPARTGAVEDAAHEEARRLARLLVSEIKLYNEEQIEEGRRTGSIYQRLKEDIDRSRQMYEERIDERVRQTSDYFYDELVRSLAGGNAGLLGM
jgi:hypothetical protein